jgi:hypothetical protein
VFLVNDNDDDDDDDDEDDDHGHPPGQYGASTCPVMAFSGFA